MNQTLSVLFIVTALTVTTARAETWPQAPGLSSPIPAGATDLKPATPPPTSTEKITITTFTTSEPQKAPATPTPPVANPPATPTTTDEAPSFLRLDTPPPSDSAPASPLFPAPSAPSQ